MVRSEVNRAREKHKPINSLHEGYAVLLEEVDEFWEEVKKKRESRDHSKMLSELVQVAAMSQRTAEDCGLTQTEPKPWPTERPPGWGVGWWCRWVGGEGIVIHRFVSAGVPIAEMLNLTSNKSECVQESEITSFGPRAEVPG